MIISPTVASGLSQDYKVILPDPLINMQVAKAISSVKTISGSGSVTVWAGSIVGDSKEMDLTVSTDKYKILQQIKDTGVNEWLVRMHGRIFVCVFDMPVAMKSKVRRGGFYDVVLVLVITEEVTA